MKVKRQSKILEIIKDNEVDTQEALAEMLNAAGFNVTQATVSRDIRELKLTKVSVGMGKQKYTVISNEDNELGKRLKRVFRDGVTAIDFAQNIIVIKTLTGMAMAVAAALDAMDNSEVMGTIAGDDTVFCVVKNEAKAIRLIEKLKVNINKN